MAGRGADLYKLPSRVLSLHYSGARVLVVLLPETTTILCLAQIQMKGMSELARRLMADATADGADPPLQMALPHTRVLSQSSGALGNTTPLSMPYR